MLGNPALELLRIIGSPLTPLPSSDREESVELYSHAVKNKIPLLYLDCLKQLGKLNKLKSEYDAWVRKALQK